MARSNRTTHSPTSLVEVSYQIGEEGGPWGELRGDLEGRFVDPAEIQRCWTSWKHGRDQYRLDSDTTTCRCGECGTPVKFTAADRRDWVAALATDEVLPHAHAKLSLGAFKAFLERHFRSTRTGGALGLCRACRREMEDR